MYVLYATNVCNWWLIRSGKRAASRRRCWRLCTNESSMCYCEVTPMNLDGSMRHSQQPKSMMRHIHVLLAPCCHISVCNVQIHELARVIYQHQTSKRYKQLLHHAPSECNAQRQHSNRQHGQAAACACIDPHATWLTQCVAGLSRMRAVLGTDCRFTTLPRVRHMRL